MLSNISVIWVKLKRFELFTSTDLNHVYPLNCAYTETDYLKSLKMTNNIIR